MKKDSNVMFWIFWLIAIFLISSFLHNYNNKNTELDKETNDFLVKVVVDKEITSPIIDLDAIWFIESSNGKNLWNKKSRARGHYQFLETTWNECIGKIEVDWDWWTCSMDRYKSRLVADYYYNIEIPRLLKHYNIDDNINTRIACYSWGIGHLNKNWKLYNNKWLEFAPDETKKYIEKYRKFIFCAKNNNL